VPNAGPIIPLDLHPAGTAASPSIILGYLRPMSQRRLPLSDAGAAAAPGILMIPFVLPAANDMIKISCPAQLRINKYPPVLSSE